MTDINRKFNEVLTSAIKIAFLLIIYFTWFSLSVQAKENNKDNIKIIGEIKKNGYVDEAIVYEVKLISTSPDIADVRTIKAPAFPNGLKVVQGAVKNVRPEKFEEKGKVYYSWIIQRSYFIPEKSGKFSIGEGRYVVFIPHEKIVNNNFWGPRRIIDYEEIILESKGIDFKIASLPPLKIADDYSGCVGDFKVEAWFPPGKIEKGREAYVVFNISGFGNLKNLRIPNLYKNFGNGCVLKEVEQNEEVMQRDGKLYSEVTLTCRFLPESEEFEIKPISFLFFNPGTKKYYKSASESLHWTVKLEKANDMRTREAIEI